MFVVLSAHLLYYFGSIYDSPKYLNYRLSKSQNCYENYLNLLPADFSIAIIKCIFVNHKFPVE